MQDIAVVVGGGLAGLSASLLLRKNYSRVVLVEASEHVGGLLGSMEFGGQSFDFGTHLIASTGSPDIDSLIVPENWQRDWVKLERDRAGHYFKGVLTPDCGFVHTQHFQTDVYEASRRDLMKLESSGPEEGFPNLQVQLERTFGVGFAHYLFAPVLTKFLGDHPLNVLAVDTHKLFGLRRIVIDSPEATRMLKQRPFFDERIAFHASSEGAASHAQFYPKRGGVDDWMKKLATAAEDAGVEILTSTKVTAVRCERNRLSELGFSNGTIIRPDSVFWSAPLFTLGKLLPSAPPPVSPVFRKSVLVHLVFDEAPTIDSFYVLCFDPRLRNFRTTLYSNFQPGSDTHRATVEFLLSPEDPAHETHFIETAKRELASMGIFPPRARVLAAHFHEIQNGFPVLTTQSQKAKAQQLDWFAQHLTNVAMIGRANTKHWFMVDVLRDILTKTQ